MYDALAHARWIHYNVIMYPLETVNAANNCDTLR